VIAASGSQPGSQRQRPVTYVAGLYGTRSIPWQLAFTALVSGSVAVLLTVLLAATAIGRTAVH
jgi:hypothetical protein